MKGQFPSCSLLHFAVVKHGSPHSFCCSFSSSPVSRESQGRFRLDLELENSESLFLKTSDSDPGTPPPPPFLFLFLILSLYLPFCLFVSLCLYLSFFPSRSLPPPPPPPLLSLLCHCREVEGRRRAKVTSVIWFRPLSSLGQPSDSAGPACCSFLPASICHGLALCHSCNETQRCV